jgi:transposase InsO family protein
MTINMDDSHIVSIAQLKEFSKLNPEISFTATNKKERNEWIEKTLFKFGYFKLKKKHRHTVKGYIIKMTGLSNSQIKKLIAKKKRFGKIFLSSTKRNNFPKKYWPEDIARLLETDNAHSRLSGPATKKILGREYQIFNHENYKNISQISVAHIYNLRDTNQYRSHALTVKKTNPVGVKIGERRRPEPQGQPGFLRVDSVHQGDLEKEKGVYHINLVDEVTQWEIVGCVERISEYFLEPLLEDLLAQFPFVILNFHSDNGSEYINKTVAKLLNKLLARQTKSRPHHSGDNALAECKNGWIIRKQIGYSHIPKQYAPLINQFYKSYLNPYLNFHRPCGYATIIEDPKKKGKLKKVYDIYLMPYEKLISLSDFKKYLKPEVTFEMLNKAANEKSDNEFAALMQKEKQELFNKFNRYKLQFPTMYTSFISGSYVD